MVLIIGVRQDLMLILNFNWPNWKRNIKPIYPQIWGLTCGFSIRGTFINRGKGLIQLWLVVWNIFFIFPHIGNHHPNWLSYFSDIFQRGRSTTNQNWDIWSEAFLIGTLDFWWFVGCLLFGNKPTASSVMQIQSWECFPAMRFIIFHQRHQNKQTNQQKKTPWETNIKISCHGDKPPESCTKCFFCT